jgi:Ca-activated chloride channel family protein
MKQSGKQEKDLKAPPLRRLRFPCWQNELSNLMCRRTLQFLVVLTLLATVLIGSRVAASLQAARPEGTDSESTFSLKVNVDLVVLNLAVIDEGGRNVVNLRHEDFSLYEDGAPQTITEFLPTEAPFNLALVLDTSGSAKPNLSLIKKAGIEFTQQLQPKDKIGIVVFNSSVTQLQNFTTDRGLLKHTLNSLTTSTFGGSKVYDAVAQAVYRLRELSTGRSAIVILSDGMENASRIKFDGLRLLLAQSDAVFYPITVLGRQRQQEELQAYISSHPESDPYVANARESLAVLSKTYQLQKERLAALANDCGGKVFVVSSLQDLAGEYGKIAQELRNTYSVAYYPTNLRRDGSLRSVRVKVNNPRYQVRTRSSYFVPKEE